MARRTQFLDLVTMLRNELGRSTSVSVGVDDLPRLKHHLNRAYETRFDEHDWPHLRKLFSKIAMNASQSLYDFPSDLDYTRIEGTWVWWNSRPYGIDRGITPDDYAIFDTTSAKTSAPILKWDVRDAAGQVQFEVWPMPSASAVQTVQFLGHRKVTKLVNDADLCLLDDWLIVLDAAAALTKDVVDKKQKSAEAETRFITVRANTVAGEAPVRYNLGSPPADPLKGVTIRVG